MIVVHSYISRGNYKPRNRITIGEGKAVTPVGRGIQYLKYIQHRAGEDKEKGGRVFFDEEEDRLDPSEVRKQIRSMEGSKVVLHSLTFSPQINLEDKKALVRDVMAKFAEQKGQDLRWVAVEHNNTDHFHVHVVLLGKDEYWKDVFIKKSDYATLRQLGDSYLERFHSFELDLALVQKDKARQAAERAKELIRAENIRDGLELPWLHKKIVREMYEPYEQWQKKQKANRELKESKKSERNRKRDGIKAAGKYWTSENSLSDLQGLNEHLWDNFSEHIDKDSYRKLVGWIREKETQERSGKVGQNSSNEESIEYGGKVYTEASSFEDLSELSRLVHSKKAKKLSIDAYQSMRLWLNGADRARWQGILNQQIELSKMQHERNEFQRFDPNNSRSPGTVATGRVAGLFGPIAAIGRFAYEMVMLFDFSGGGGGGLEDRRTTEIIYQPDMHRPIR